jgi:1-acyl-sn-glycerol-3-phosphate acyltransferase
MMKRLLSKLIFKLNGWRIIGPHVYPEKCLVIAAPHTSNWDFFIGRCYAYIIGIQPKYLVKSELFLPVLATLLKWNGGIPVFRKAKNNVVEQVVDMFENTNQLHLGIAPEGTRKKVVKWKTGFYYIALTTKVPLLLFAMDYQKKEVGVMTELIITGDFEKDMLFIQQQYANIIGKIPENYNEKIY